MDRKEVINAIGYNVRVICGFPGVGKTRARGAKTIDLNLQDIPREYHVDVIRHKLSEGYIVLVASWEFLRSQLRIAGIEYAVVYPSTKLRAQYLERLANRKGGASSSKYMQKMASQYKSMVRSCMFDPSPYHICLENIDENLADYL